MLHLHFIARFERFFMPTLLVFASKYYSGLIIRRVFPFFSYNSRGSLYSNLNKAPKNAIKYPTAPVYLTSTCEVVQMNWLIEHYLLFRPRCKRQVIWMLWMSDETKGRLWRNWFQWFETIPACTYSAYLIMAFSSSSSLSQFKWNCNAPPESENLYRR